MKNRQFNIVFNWRRLNDVRIVVAAFGILCGLTGIIAGVFEILQGNFAPSGLIISTIGPDYSMANDFTYFSITIVPNFFATGILAIISSCLVITWSVKFIDRKNGALIFLGLSIMQMLVGGGWEIDLAIVTSIIASRIDKPLNWWRKNLPEKLMLWLSRLFPYSLLIYGIVSFIMLALTALGVDNADYLKPMDLLAAFMFIPILFMIFGGFACEVEKGLS